MSMSPSVLERRAVTRRLTRRYVLALSIIATLAILGQAAVQLMLRQQANDARGINEAAQQVTLSERMSTAALAILASTDGGARDALVTDLSTVVAQWQRTQVALQQSDPTLSQAGPNSPEVNKTYVQIAPHFNAMLDAATDILVIMNSRPPIPLPSTPPVADAIGPYVQRILAEKPSFVVGMNTIVAEYQREAEGRVVRLQVIEWTLLSIDLVVLFLLGMLVFRPVTRQVGQSVTELIQAQEQEHELAALKDQFIIDANHELRTPIMSMYNNLEILSALGETGTPEQRARMLQRALTSGEAVLRLLTTVLDTSALEGKLPTLRLETVTLAPLVQGVLETFDPREIGEPALHPGEYESRAVKVRIGAELAVVADEVRLRQILTNLLSNALKYSAPGTALEISAGRMAPTHAHHASPRDSNSVVDSPSEQIQVTVRDYGLGVPPSEQMKLFNRFVRLERDIAGTVRGTGVGLYLCRVLVEAMGGRIWVESTGVPGEGTAFSFTLPDARRHPVRVH